MNFQEISILFDIPKEITLVLNTLHTAGFEAYIVGGCVRDSIMNRQPKDWDIVTSAYPEEITALCDTKNQKYVYENPFGTVSWINEDQEKDSPLREIQITPYRTESKYSDNRRPDSVLFTRNLYEDISRRDFTMNGLVYDIQNKKVLDYTNGVSDILAHTIRCIGNPENRFQEDALRIVRAIRFSAQLSFTIDSETLDALKKTSELLKNISQERIRDEFIKIINSNNVKQAIEISRETNVLEQFLPELLEGFGCEQSRSHVYDVYTHNLNACQNSASMGWSFHVRLAALFHDIGKPRTRRWDDSKKLYTFYGHEVVGAKMVKSIMKRMNFSRETSERVEKLVRYHMFFSDTETITLSAVRRMIQNVGKDMIWDLMDVRKSDRIGMGKENAEPYRLRKYEAMIEEVLSDPISVGMLVIDGNDLLQEFHMKPGTRIGWMLHALLEIVLEDPKKNTKNILAECVKQFSELNDTELCRLGRKGIQEKVARETIKKEIILKKHKVK